MSITTGRFEGQKGSTVCGFIYRCVSQKVGESCGPRLSLYWTRLP